MERTELSEEVVERLIRAGALDSLGRPRRELLWQLREVAGATRGGSTAVASRLEKRAAGPADGPPPAADRGADLPAITELERLGDAYAVVGLDARARWSAVPRGAGSPRRGAELVARRGRPGRSGSAAWWSPASTR